ncbi:NAD(P)H-dependent oxidoreductase [Endozoicomonas arenosclerae]|uniref:NAD(P)H-dependent oxidoreductase n=1 Tax=Endozoicomonas arenosclerae TaxID=1633495 RepID=UPI000785DD29|nr:NAD(P)H-dependent oxidoreductase [Endozoicomonas arenosclerae]
MKATTKQQILEAFQFRHACKSFDAERKIPDEDFNFILDAGLLSPSSFGFEPWKFLVIQDMDIRKKMLPVCWGAEGQLPTASHFMVILARKEPGMIYSSPYIEEHMREVEQLPDDIVDLKSGFYKTFQTDHFKLTESPRAMFDWSCKQTYIALGNMLSVSAQIGIDSCPIEGFDLEALEGILEKEGLLDRHHFGISCLAAFGYRQDEPRPKTRSPKDRLIQWVR